MIAAMMATVDPGEEVIVFEPFYENYARTQFFPTPGHATCRCARPTGVLTATNCARLQRQDKSNHHLQSQQSHGQGLHAL